LEECVGSPRPQTTQKTKISQHLLRVRPRQQTSAG
jgi:hypothetical protein